MTSNMTWALKSKVVSLAKRVYCIGEWKPGQLSNDGELSHYLNARFIM